MNYFYGGAFNPMTKAHLNIITSILLEMKKDDLLIIGITNHDYKTYDYSYELRNNILQKNLLYYGVGHGKKHIKIYEQNQRTWKYLTENPELSTKRPLTLVLGEDEYEDLKSLNVWHYSKEILDTFQIKVFSRSDDTKDISSTKVRELLKQNVNYSQLEKYITKETWNFLKEKKK